MRQVVLDTETTGLEAHLGHRLVEIGAVEMIGRRPTGRNFHTYLNPERKIDEEASKVTGIKDEDLVDQPLFRDKVDEFLEFIRGAELIIHNAAFDVGFIDAELKRLGPNYGSTTDYASVLDTLTMARTMYPGQRNSLDALCKRLGVDNSRRDVHGGLLDAQLLADVYVAMTSGQVVLDLAFDASADHGRTNVLGDIVITRRPVVRRATAEELELHTSRLDALDKAAGGQSVWRKLESETIH
ncbi:MAG: DNA polymerase III subunit epsilon [Luteibacter sp.]|uniref:DNA polymerase III subunit epsilon n=1 Tax=Luteibacter sp. TaxID=1886636 RepID=UPI002808C007|nr:DNA polymerase III subunit epsilon [Luteibacter sp.]MDQ7996731.1 DNA polymerase III subunit epsilon [Luteibacter sp.]MDQ8049726.1 DNA polymerase III subunit epsilon [Luteibacter sp.]